MKLKPMFLMMNKQHASTPRFISFEGGEGAGKSTLMNRLVQLFRKKNVPLITTREPGGTPFGEQLRQWLLDHKRVMHYSAKAELMLFLAARVQHIEEKIVPALRDGVLVLCDRFNDSTIAYQGAGRGLGIEWVKNLCDSVCQGVQPDLTFYLDLDPEVGLMRTRRSDKQSAPAGKLDRIEAETLQFHRQVREAFQVLAQREPQRIQLIDASLPLDTVYQSALTLVSERFHYV